MKLKITIDDKNYEVDVEVAEHEALSNSSRPQSVESAAVRAPIAVTTARPKETLSVAEEKVCRSPLSGLVASISAQPGQKLQAGDALLMLEAMKMETCVTAPVAGVVAAIKVKVGDGVQLDQVLVEFE